MKLESIIRETNNSKLNFFYKKFNNKLLPVTWIARGIVPILFRRFKGGFRYTINYIDNDQGWWFWADADLTRTREKILKSNRVNTRQADGMLRAWKKDWTKLIRHLNSLDKIDFFKLTDREFVKVYNKIWLLYNLEMSLPQLVDCFLSSGKEDWFLTMLKSYFQQKKISADADSVFATLTQPVCPSFVNREHIGLLKMALKLQKRANIGHALARHQKNYYWIENNYHHARFLDEKYFLAKIRRLAREKNIVGELKVEENRTKTNKKAKQELFKVTTFSKEIRNIVSLIEKFTYWQDCRKEGVLRVNHYVFKYLIPEIARRACISVEEAGNLLAEELEELILGEFDKSCLKRRNKLYFIYDKDGNHWVLTGEEAERINLNNLLGIKETKKIDELKGMVASKGFARGSAKIILKPSEFGKMAQGDILITNNTTPEFMPIIKKASAIVVEQGGVTIHAAIISRELGIPCVIGTKIATQVFKDGDMVEVDAENGIVRKIN